MAKTTFTTSTHWGALRATTQDGRISSVTPFEHDPNPSDIINSIPAAVHHRTRVARPSIRQGWLNGDRNRSTIGDFVEVPWDEALDIAAQELKRVVADHGNGSIFGGSYGWSSAGRFHHAQGQLHRFLNTIGGYVAHRGSYSAAGAYAIIPHIFGVPNSAFDWDLNNLWPVIVKETETFLMFGGINEKNAQVNAGGIACHHVGEWLRQCHERGANLVNVSPQRSDAPEFASWIPMQPGTDVTFMLGLAYTLETEGLADHGFLQRCTTGYDLFRTYLLGQNDGTPKTPEWAEQLCGISAEDIRALAHKMASTRTLITVSWSLQRARFGEQPYWMAATLAAMLGQIGLAGGGIGYGYGAVGGIGAPGKRISGCTLPQGENLVEDYIPVARIADMLLAPGTSYEYNGETRTYPHIELIYWAGGNPYHHHQDLSRLNKAWNQPATVIVQDPWWTASAQRADIVFPATTAFEREDIGRDKTDPYLFHMPQIIPPVGGARNDFDIFNQLSKRMQTSDAFSENRTADEWQAHLYDQFHRICTVEGIIAPTLAELRDQNWVKLDIPDIEQPIPFAEFRADPKANPLPTPSGRIEIFSKTIAGYEYSDCPPHPTWMPTQQATGYPLQLITPQPADKLHSQLESALADDPDARPMRIGINPSDAASRNILNGSMVEVSSPQGKCRARAELSAGILTGVVALPTGAWYLPDHNGRDQSGNPNVLTVDVGTSQLAQGSSARTAYVEIRPISA